MSDDTLPGYRLTPPTEEDARASLERICCDGAGARWQRLRDRAAAGPGALTLPQLAMVAERCVEGSGCERVFGVSLLVRIQTYMALHAMTAQAVDA